MTTHDFRRPLLHSGARLLGHSFLEAALNVRGRLMSGHPVDPIELCQLLEVVLEAAERLTLRDREIVEAVVAKRSE